MVAPLAHQFKEEHKVRGVPVRILSEQGLGALVGERAQVHMHTPATKQLGRPVYSVLVNKKVVGQTESIYLKDSKMRVDRKELENHLKSPTGAKTRNTFVEGVVHPAPAAAVDKKLKIRPGSMVDAETGEDVSSSMSTVHLGPSGARYRK